VPPPIFSWTGCYLGIEGGGSFGQSQHTSVGAVNPANNGRPITDEFSVNGGLFGGTVGCNYQFSNVVTGIENDFLLDQLQWDHERYSAIQSGGKKFHEGDLARYVARPRWHRMGSLLFLGNWWRGLRK
jgi:hypothetical protein